ncbi:LysR family substrate-binding domain-containing protein [Streptomyces sp. NPDC054834]
MLIYAQTACASRRSGRRRCRWTGFAGVDALPQAEQPPDETQADAHDDGQGGPVVHLGDGEDDDDGRTSDEACDLPVSLEVEEYDFRSPEAGLDTGAVDAAILRPPVDLPYGSDVRVLRSEPRVACVSDLHPLAARTEVSVADLLDQPIVAAPGSGAWRDYWLLRDHRGGNAPPVVYEAATFEAELQAVASGRGISITPATAARFYARPGLAFPVITDVSWCDVAVVLPPNPLPAARRFARLAQQIAGATPEVGAGPVQPQLQRRGRPSTFVAPQ